MMLTELRNPWMMLPVCLLLRKCAFETKSSIGFREFRRRAMAKKNTIIFFSLCRHFINWSQNLRARESFVGSCLSIFSSLLMKSLSSCGSF